MEMEKKKQGRGKRSKQRLWPSPTDKVGRSLNRCTGAEDSGVGSYGGERVSFESKPTEPFCTKIGPIGSPHPNDADPAEGNKCPPTILQEGIKNAPEINESFHRTKFINLWMEHLHFPADVGPDSPYQFENIQQDYDRGLPLTASSDQENTIPLGAYAKCLGYTGKEKKVTEDTIDREWVVDRINLLNSPHWIKKLTEAAKNDPDYKLHPPPPPKKVGRLSSKWSYEGGWMK